MMPVKDVDSAHFEGGMKYNFGNEAILLRDIYFYISFKKRR